MSIDWNPVAHVGPIPINWYGLTFALGFLVGGAIVRRYSLRYGIKPDQVDTAVLWIAVGTMIGARLYYVVQNDVSVLAAFLACATAAEAHVTACCIHSPPL